MGKFQSPPPQSSPLNRGRKNLERDCYSVRDDHSGWIPDKAVSKYVGVEVSK